MKSKGKGYIVIYTLIKKELNLLLIFNQWLLGVCVDTHISVCIMCLYVYVDRMWTLIVKFYFLRCLEDTDPYWQSEHSLVIKEIENSDKIKMVLNFNHTIIFREFAVRDQRKFELVMELRKIFAKLGLKTEVKSLLKVPSSSAVKHQVWLSHEFGEKIAGDCC